MKFDFDDLNLIYDDSDAIEFSDGMHCLDLIQRIGDYIESRVEPAGWSSVEFTAEDVEAVTGFTGLDTGTLDLHKLLASRVGQRMALKMREAA